jgi:hypothetical protein
VTFFRFGLCLSAAIAALALGGCANSGSPLPVTGAGVAENTSGAVAASLLSRVQQLYARSSWMLPEAKNEPLFYIADYSENHVNVYTYPDGKQVGQLTADMLSPDGLCVNKNGDIWVVNNTPNENGVVEFKHGGTKPIATLVDPSQYPNSCSVNFATGDLAVSNHDTTSSGPGSVSVYKDAKGYPKMYGIRTMRHVYFCGYDNKGNLFIDGILSGYIAEFAELAKGAHALKSIKFKGATIMFPGQIQWDGKHLAVGDQRYQNLGSHYNSAIYETTGAGGKVVGLTKLGDSWDVPGFWIDKGTVVAPNWAQSVGKPSVNFYKYPAGGKITKKLAKDFVWPIAATISP